MIHEQSSPMPADAGPYGGPSGPHARGSQHHTRQLGRAPAAAAVAAAAAVPTVSAERKKALFGPPLASISAATSAASSSSAEAVASRPHPAASASGAVVASALSAAPSIVRALAAAPPAGETERDRRLRERMQQRQTKVQGGGMRSPPLFPPTSRVACPGLADFACAFRPLLLHLVIVQNTNQ